MRQSMWKAVAVFVAVTFVVSGVGFWLQVRYAIAWWVFNLGSFGPLVGGLVTLALRKRLGLDVVYRPGWGFNIQLIRRCCLAAAVALAIVLLCVQFYTFFRWQMKPVWLADLPHPLALPADVMTITGFIALGILIGVALQEFGWRAVLEPTVRAHFPVLKTAIVVGVIWATWSWPAWQAVIDRLQLNGTPLEAVLFLGGHYVVCVAVSLILVLLHRKMHTGHWATAVVFRFVYDFGFFLILDEELGRWQAMFAIALCTSLAAGIAYYYYWRGQKRADSGDRKTVPDGVAAPADHPAEAVANESTAKP